LVKVVFHKV